MRISHQQGNHFVCLTDSEAHSLVEACAQMVLTVDPDPRISIHLRWAPFSVSCLRVSGLRWAPRPAEWSVCITCQDFRYEVGKHCDTLLTCPIHQGLTPQGEHLTKRCAQWVPRREVREGWCPEAG